MSEHIRLLSLSRRFLDAAVALSVQGGQTYRFPVPHYLAGHAIELALKAHLAHRGADEAALIKLRHNLEAALARADADVRAVLTLEQVAAIRWLNSYYAGKHLEYTAWGKAGRLVSVPDVSFLLGAATRLADHLHLVFRATP